MEAATAAPAPAPAPAPAEPIDHDGDVQGPPAESSPDQGLPADSNHTDGLRSYVVLEQRDLSELVATLFAAKGIDLDDDDAQVLSGLTVLLNLGTYPSKNTEHALRQAAKQAYDDTEHAEPTLIPVSETYWRPTRLTVKNERTVTFA